MAVGGGVGVTYLALHKRVCMCRGGGICMVQELHRRKN